MTRSQPRVSPPAAAKELQSIISPLATIRILNSIAKSPAAAANHTSHPDTPPAELKRILARLRRHGWVQAEASAHRITPRGRKALQAAASRLKQVAALTSRRR
jgi:DNA-binding IclR family transcriptional regulator